MESGRGFLSRTVYHEPAPAPVTWLTVREEQQASSGREETDLRAGVVGSMEVLMTHTGTRVGSLGRQLAPGRGTL